MKKIKYLIMLVMILPIIMICSGCSNDSMDNIEIIVTNYPCEYITKKIYDKHATITSIYPDGVDINNYKISSKQKHDFANKDLFIYSSNPSLTF